MIVTLAPPTREDVNRERDRRVSAGIVFQGVEFESDAASRQALSEAATMALGAIAAGKQIGDTKWTAEGDEFFWIASDNTRVAMDAQTCLALATAMSEHKSNLVRCARKLKDADTTPYDYKDDRYWT